LLSRFTRLHNLHVEIIIRQHLFRTFEKIFRFYMRKLISRFTLRTKLKDKNNKNISSLDLTKTIIIL